VNSSTKKRLRVYNFLLTLSIRNVILFKEITPKNIDENIIVSHFKNPCFASDLIFPLHLLLVPPDRSLFYQPNSALAILN